MGYFSKSVPRHKRQWGQTKLEFESLCASLKHWDVYLRGAKSFVVKTDCKSLLNYFTIFKTNPTMIRRFEQLLQYSFTLEHISGELNYIPDFLSRYGMKSKEHDKACQTEETRTAPSSSINHIQLERKEHRESVSHSDRTEDVASCLEKLFDENQECGVTTICAIASRESFNCYCHIPEMEQECSINALRDNIGPSSAPVTTTETAPDVTPDRSTICREQDKDQILKIVKQWVREGEKPKLQSNRAPAELVSLWKQFSTLKLSDDGLLLKKWVSRKTLETERELIVVPDSLIESIMKLHHSDLTTCHPGVDISVNLCRRKFYWPKMTEDFKEYIAVCETCSAIKQPQRYLRAPLQHLLFHSFNEAIIVDHIVVEAGGRTPRGYRYILTITDAWSNYLVAIPVKTQTAKENIEQIVRRWILTFGMPKEIIVDNHPGFSAEFFEAVWNYFDCKVTHGTSYKSRSTGKAEMSNKRVNKALRAAIPDGKQKDWDIYLGYCVMALNSLKNRHTGFSSNRLVFGRENNTPISLLVDNEVKTEPLSKSSRGAYEKYKLMKAICRKVRENANVDFLYAKNHHDRNLLGPYFKAGDLCYVLINCPTHKHSIRWRGPLLVNKVINDHLYVVQISPGQEKVINISKMKHFKRNKYKIHKYLLPPHPSNDHVPPGQDSTSITPSPNHSLKPSKQVTFPSTLNDSDSDSDDDYQVVNLPVFEKRSRSSAVPSSTDKMPSRTQRTTEGGPPSINLNTSLDSTDSTVTFDTISEADPILSPISKQDSRNHRYNLRNRETLKPPGRYDTKVEETLQRSKTNRSMGNTIKRLFCRVRDRLDGI